MLFNKAKIRSKYKVSGGNNPAVAKDFLSVPVPPELPPPPPPPLSPVVRAIVALAPAEPALTTRETALATVPKLLAPAPAVVAVTSSTPASPEPPPPVPVTATLGVVQTGRAGAPNFIKIILQALITTAHCNQTLFCIGASMSVRERNCSAILMNVSFSVKFMQSSINARSEERRV